MEAQRVCGCGMGAAKGNQRRGANLQHVNARIYCSDPRTLRYTLQAGCAADSKRCAGTAAHHHGAGAGAGDGAGIGAGSGVGAGAGAYYYYYAEYYYWSLICDI